MCDQKNTTQWLLYHHRSVELFNIATDQWALSQAVQTLLENKLNMLGISTCLTMCLVLYESSDGRFRLPAKLHWYTACRRVTTIVWHSLSLQVTILMQRVNICPSMHQTRSPQCLDVGINELILFEVGMRSEIKQFIEGMIVMITMWIAPISSSNCLAAVIAEAIEVYSKPLDLFSLSKLKCYMCMYK